jgi:diguanylate cyclase (GGDEF)-like protein
MELKKLSHMFRFGIRQKVVLVLITVLLTALTVSGWLALQKEKENVLEEINRRGSDISRFVATSLAFSVVGYDYHTAQLLLDEIVSSKDIGYAKVLSVKGKLMAESGSLDDLAKGDQKLVMFNEQIKIDGQVVGQLHMGLSTRATILRLESQKYDLVKREAFIILLIALGEFLALSFIIIRPVSIMTDSLNQSIDDEGKIAGEIPIHTRDEFGLLASQFNGLRKQLNEANETLQSKIELSDKRLIENNQQLQKQAKELQRMNTEFKRMAVTDPLTGLYNRRHFCDLMEKEIALSRRHGDTNSILLIDIDHFKNINDTYGHLEGDTVLASFANMLKKTIRHTDILCRIGGEEFVVFCRRAGKRESIVAAEKIRSTISKMVFDSGASPVHITTSIGIATFPYGNLETIDDIIKCADLALYHCKENGRNQVAHFLELSDLKTQHIHTLA